MAKLTFCTFKENRTPRFVVEIEASSFFFKPSSKVDSRLLTGVEKQPRALAQGYAN